MFRTGMCCFGLKKWIFLIAYVNLFTYIQGVENDEGVRFMQEPSDVVVAAGENILLPCAAASLTNPRLTWRHNDKAPPTREHTISITDKYRRQLANGSLLIEHMSASLAGQYQCVATIDRIGTIVSRVATVFLAELPEVLAGPRSVLGIVGGPVLLPCAVRASPRLAVRVVPATPDRRVYGSTRQHHTPPTLKLNVTWLKNGSPVRLESARAAVTPSGALELDAARAHDAARYACRVALAHAPHTYRTSEEIELRISSEVGAVESSPRFVATPQPITVIEGASVTFDCAAVGNPKPEMIWLNNGAAIDLSDLDSRFYLVGSGSLRVQSARALDAGAYTCRAHSRLDSADHSATLHVLSVPRVTVGNPADKGVVVARTRGDVTLRCEAKGRPTPTVTWLKDGEPLTPNNHDIALVDGTSLRIQGVLRVDAGMFQCAAISPAGTAVAGLRLLVQSPDDETGFSNATVLQTSHKSKTKHPKKQKPPKNNNPKPSDFVSHTNGTVQNPNSTQDIFNSLISSTQFEDQNLDPAPEDLDFVGETSSAFTSGPELEYDEGFEYDYDTDYMFHAAQGLDLDELRKGNATLVSPPRDLRAVIVKHRFVTLSWQEPENTKEHITGYAVVYKVKGSDRERVARGGAQKHEMNVASLQPNTSYEFAVLAFTQNAHSPLTDVISVTTPEEELSYGPPLDVRVEASGPHSLKVSWLPPDPPPEPASSAPPYPPTKYSIHYYETESGREQVQWVEASGGVGTQSAAVGGLRAAATYSVRVCAAGGALSAEVRARTRSDAPAAPPANVTAAPSGPHSILVRWEAPPARTHRGPLTGYKVRYRALQAGPQGASQGQTRRKADALTTPADARRAELRQLHTHTTYQIRVCAINANGSGPFSEWVTATTQQQELDESVVPPQPPPLTTRAGRDWISVWWSEEGGSAGGGGVVVRGYWLGWGLGVPDEHTQEVPAHLHSHVIRGLASNSEYVISLRASNALGLGPAVYATVRTRAASESDGDGDEDEDEPGDEDADGDEDEDESPPLIPPVGVKVIMLSGSTAVVYWTDPTLAKGTTASDGRRYVVRWATPGLRARYFNATDLNCMLDDLKPYTDYEFAVKLIRGQRESAWSMLVSNRTLEALPASAPRDLRAAPAAPTGRALELSWQPPLKPHGRLTGYVLMYCASDAPDDWAAVAVTGGDRVRARVDRLRPRTTYLFKVQARNSKGLGPFSLPMSYTTPVETGGGSGLAGATSAWLWASAGGACAVLALAAALALSLCCRRSHPPLSPDTSTYQKSSASAAIKPPDLWIHHDQMELKHMDKSLHSSAISAGSVEGVGGGGAGGGLMSSTLTLARAAHAPPAEYEPARHHAPASLASLSSLDRRHYVPTYVERRSPCACQSAASSDDTAILRASPASMASMASVAPLKRCDACLYDYKSMTGVSCASTCERRPHRAPLQLPHTDQSTPLLAGVAPLGSPQAPLGPLGPQQGPLHHPCPMMPGTGSDIYASAARERGHYVAYEPLGHYTHRDSLSSECGTAGSSGAGVGGLASGGGPGSVGSGAGVGGAGGSLQRRVPPAHGPHGPLHSFTLPDSSSSHSTPSHGKGSVRETSPYKKSANSSPGHLPNRLQLGGSVAHCSEELEPLTPSRSTERLNREMQNLEGLMKDLSAITQHQFHC